MSVNKVNSDGSLLRVAGGTLYADLPIASEIEYAGTTPPNGFLACDGSTITQSAYPELYAIIGGTLPSKSGYIIKAKQVAVPFDVAEYIRNQNVLSDIETVTLPMTAPYDGELVAVGSNGGYVTFRINGNEYTVGSSAGMTNTSGLSIKKGDNLQLSALIGTAGFTARYYKLRDYTGR